MTVNEICDSLKNEIIGLKSNMVPIYVQDLTENNISGQVLATCQLDELKSVKTKFVCEKKDETKRFFCCV